MRQLRNLSQLNQFHLQARDGEVGQVENFVLDDNDWKIRYLEINTHRRLRPGP